MAYVRVRGRQLAIVQSRRDPKRREVLQEVLFVLYSRAEARAALGRGVPGGAEAFRSVLRSAYPELPLNWRSIRRGIEAHMEILPESAPAGEDAAREPLRETVHAFLRELAQADPELPMPGHRPTLDSLVAELRFAHDLLGKRLEALQSAPPARPQVLEKHPPLWRFGTWRERPSPDIEEAASELYERGDLDAAEERFRVLADLFPRYPEAPNLLGCIALDRGDLPRARACFEKTVEIARKLFPARIARTSWWSLLETRPYIRGLHNLASTLIRERKYPEAFAIAERLKNECFQVERAMMLRARIHLNMGRFEDAAKEAAGLVEIWPSEAFVAGFALAEEGDAQEAAACLLYATLHHPETARALANGRAREPRSWREERDWDALEELRDNLPTYFVRRKNTGLTALRTLLRIPRIVSLVERSQILERRHLEGRGTDREAFDERAKMLTLDFARGVVAGLAAEGGREQREGRESP